MFLQSHSFLYLVVGVFLFGWFVTLLDFLFLFCFVLPICVWLICFSFVFLKSLVILIHCDGIGGMGKRRVG